jgi:O-antigen/teichoic acid export membrane protein
VLLPPRDLGLFGIAKRSLLLAQLPAQMAMYSILATVPRLHTQGRARELETLMRGASTWAALPALGAIVALVLFPGPILRIVFGESFESGAPVILPLALGALAMVLLGNPAYVLLMTGHQRLVLVVNGVSFVALVIGASLGARWYGTVGLATGSAASVVLQNSLLWWLVHRELGLWTHVGWPTWSGLSSARTSQDNLPRDPERLPTPLAEGEPIPS